MPSFFSRKINFTTGKENPINFTSPSIGSHSKNIRRALNNRVNQTCSCNTQKPKTF